MKYLQQIIIPGTLSVAEFRIKIIAALQYPRTFTYLRSFLGLCILYRRFVEENTDTVAHSTTSIKGATNKPGALQRHLGKWPSAA